MSSLDAASSPSARPAVAAVDMGYGHERAARPIAEALGVELLQVDRAPLADPEELGLWRRVRSAYEWTSRASQVRGLGAPLRRALDWATDIPHLYPLRDLSAPTRGARALDRLLERGLGRGLVAELRRTGAPLVTTFYSPALAADRAGLRRVFCVVTDSDLNRIWAPLDAARTRIRYLVPTPRAARRLRAYGVPEANVTFTGFPLPHALVGGPGLATLQRHLAARLVRLDPARAFRRYAADDLAHFLGPLPAEEEERPPLVAFAVGGAGAQAAMARLFLPSLRAALEGGRLRLALVAGARPEVAARFEEAVAESGLAPLLGGPLEILAAPHRDAYFASFEALLARTDVLWTKPSELTFYAALGLPVVCAKPVGVHERYNRRWVREAGAGLKQRDPRSAGDWLLDWLADGTLAGAAWSGFTRLPKHGLYQVVEAVRRAIVAEP